MDTGERNHRVGPKEARTRRIAFQGTIWPATPDIVAYLNDAPPSVAFVGQYVRTQTGGIRLLSVGAAANFGLREPGTDATVAVIFPPAPPYDDPSLARHFALLLREAAVSPERFKDAPPTIFLYFVAPDGRALRRAFRPELPCRRFPAWLRVRVSDLAGRTWALTALLDDLGPSLGPCGLDSVAAVVDPRGHGCPPLDVSERTDLAGLLSKAPHRYADFAAHQARLALLFALKIRPPVAVENVP